MKSLFRPAKADIKAKYNLKEIIGTGNFAEVRLGVNKETKEKFAIKISTIKDDEEYEIIKQEIEILGKLDHPNIVKLIEIFESPGKGKEKLVYMVTELVTGGELFDRIVERGHFGEREACDFVRTMILAILYMHQHNVVHRDLKPENILLQNDGENMVVKIADFGLAKVYDPNFQATEQKLHTMCGTPCYVAPEILTSKKNGGYGPEVDMWSIGVILYVLLCGFPPFFHEEQQMLFRLIVKGNFEFPSPEWDSISDQAKDFIRKLLVVKPSDRMTPEDALMHPWLQAQNVENRSVLNVKQLKRFYQADPIKKRWKGLVNTVTAANRLQSVISAPAPASAVV